MSKLMTFYGLVDLVSGEGMENIPVCAVIRKLAEMQRFGGHWDMALTVAQHSIAVQELLAHNWHYTGTPHGLVHDFSVYLTGDIPSPIIGEDFESTHSRLSRTFVRKVTCNKIDSLPIFVSTADFRIARAEMKALRFDGFTELNDPVAEAAVAKAESMDYQSVLEYYRCKGFDVAEVPCQS